MSELARHELQYLIISWAVDAAREHLDRIATTGAILTISPGEAIARIVAYALGEWACGLDADAPVAAWKRSADDVRQLLSKPEWIAVALASRSVDGRVPVDWHAIQRELPHCA